MKSPRPLPPLTPRPAASNPCRDAVAENDASRSRSSRLTSKPGRSPRLSRLALAPRDETLPPVTRHPPLTLEVLIPSSPTRPRIEAVRHRSLTPRSRPITSTTPRPPSSTPRAAAESVRSQLAEQSPPRQQFSIVGTRLSQLESPPSRARSISSRTWKSARRQTLHHLPREHPEYREMWPPRCDPQSTPPRPALQIAHASREAVKRLAAVNLESLIRKDPRKQTNP